MSPERGGPSVSVSFSTRTILVVVGVVALGWAFVTVQGSLLVVFLALFAAVVLDPPVQAVQRKLGLRRGTAVAIVVVTVIAVVALAIALIVAPLADSVRGFVDALPRLLRELRASPIDRWIEASSGGALNGDNTTQLARGVASAAGGIVGFATSTVGRVFTLLAGVFMTVFLLLDLPRIKRAVDSLLTPAGSERWWRLTDEITHTVSRTTFAAVGLGVICGTTYGLSAWALGVPYPLALGLVGGFLDLIPTVGATIAGGIIVLVALTQGFGPALVMLAIVLAYQQVENHLLQPTVVGRAARVSGFFVLASVLVFGALFGLVGAVTAVSIAATIQILLREVTASRRQRMAALRHPPRPQVEDSRNEGRLVGRREAQHGAGNRR